MRIIRLAALAALTLSLTGCVGALVAAGGESARVVAQERSVGDAVDDANIYLLLKKRYAEYKTNDLFANVEIKIHEGRVLLSGNVDQPESQIEAVRIAWEVPGVKEVINEIQINDQSGIVNYTRDVWISTQIRARLITAKGIRSVNFSILTVNQTVYIMGIAQNQEELDKVAYIASTTNYVQRVVSYAQLKDDPRRQQQLQQQ